MITCVFMETWLGLRVSGRGVLNTFKLQTFVYNKSKSTTSCIGCCVCHRALAEVLCGLNEQDVEEDAG